MLWHVTLSAGARFVFGNTRLRAIYMYVQAAWLCSCPACFAAPKERHRIKMMLSEHECEFPKLFASLLKALRPLLSITHANKEKDFFRLDSEEAGGAGAGVDGHGQEGALPCISGSAYRSRTVQSAHQPQQAVADNKTNAASGHAAAEPQACGAAGQGQSGNADETKGLRHLLAQVYRPEHEIDGEQAAEEAMLWCNFASGQCSSAVQPCLPGGRATGDACGPSGACADKTAGAASLPCQCATPIPQCDAAVNVAAGVVLGIGITATAAVCMRLVGRG